ncbi:hypothetical protein QP158_10485, partial [Streptococcus agalactiae]
SELRDPVQPKNTVTWGQLMEVWELVQADLAKVYGFVEPDLAGRPWPWFQNIVFSLLNTDGTMVREHFTPNEG